MALAGRSTSKPMPSVHGSRIEAPMTAAGGTSSTASHARPRMLCRYRRMTSPAATITPSAESMTSPPVPPIGAGLPSSTASKVPTSARPILRGREREQREQAQQDQSGIGGQQQQAEVEPEHEPIASPVLADRPPVMQQGKRGERHRQHRRAELGSGERKRDDAGHQQHR